MRHQVLGATRTHAALASSSCASWRRELLTRETKTHYSRPFGAVPWQPLDVMDAAERLAFLALCEPYNRPLQQEYSADPTPHSAVTITTFAGADAASTAIHTMGRVPHASRMRTYDPAGPMDVGFGFGVATQADRVRPHLNPWIPGCQHPDIGRRLARSAKRRLWDTTRTEIVSLLNTQGRESACVRALIWVAHHITGTTLWAPRP
jgi:hypothetical protein